MQICRDSTTDCNAAQTTQWSDIGVISNQCVPFLGLILDRHLSIAEVDEDLAGALLEHDAGDGRLAAARGGDPLRREPAGQPLLHILPKRDSRQRILLRLLLDGHHLVRGQVRLGRLGGLGRGGAQREADGAAGDGAQAQERGRVGLGGGGRWEGEVGEGGGEGGDGERHASACADGRAGAVDREHLGEGDKLMQVEQTLAALGGSPPLDRKPRVQIRA